MGKGGAIWRTLTALVFAATGMGAAQASPADGTWLLEDKLVVKIFDCESGLCGQVVWLQNPALRTPAMCGRIIIWGLTPDGPSQWSNGWIFDPQDATTYHLSATLQANDTISARIYQGIPLFGETKVLTRVAPQDRAKRCLSPS